MSIQQQEDKPDSVKASLFNEEESYQASLPSRLRAYFLAGILVTAPIGITVYLTWLFLSFIDKRVSAIIPESYNPFTYLPLSVPGIELIKAVISLIIVIFFFVLVGWFARNFLGKLLYQVSEYVLHQMPVVNTLYKAIKQVFETIMTSQSKAFREVVMLEYPRKGTWALGFVSSRTEGVIQRVTDEETMAVFVPTTPNPTSGFLLFVPSKELYFMDLTVEEAAKLVVSAGIIVPPDRGLVHAKGKRPEKKESPKMVAKESKADKAGKSLAKKTVPKKAVSEKKTKKSPKKN